MRSGKAEQDGHCHGGKKENQRGFPDPVHFMMGTQIGNAADDGGKYQRDQHHAQQVQKQGADQLGTIKHGRCSRWRRSQPGASQAQGTADQNLNIGEGSFITGIFKSGGYILIRRPVASSGHSLESRLMTDLKSLANEIKAFRDARDWRQFHSLRNLIVSLNLEAR